MTGTRTPGAVVMGLGFSGVGALHSLRDLSPRPHPIIGVDHNPREIGLVSRVGPMLLGPPPWEDEGRALCDFLLGLVERYGTKMVLYPCGDDFVRFLSLQRERLAAGFLFLMPRPETLEILMNKARFAEAAAGVGLTSPAWGIVEAVPGLKLPVGMRFPIVAKALTSLKDDPFWGVIRVRQFDTPSAWDAFFTAQPHAGARIMIQDLVVGDDTHQYVYEGLWSAESEEIYAFTVQKMRQQPPGYGSSSRAVSRLDPEVLEQSRNLLRALGYRGLVDIDFKRDARDGGLRVMEVNPRLGGIHRLGRRSGIELVQGAYRLACGEAIAPVLQPAALEGHWCHFSKDLRGLLPQMVRRPALAIPWVRSYASFPMDALFTWSDPWPWAAGLWRLVGSIVRGLRSGRWKEEKV